jgi:hypothetical protein
VRQLRPPLSEKFRLWRLCNTHSTDFVVSRDGQKRRLQRFFAELGENPDLEYLIIDSTVARAHINMPPVPKRRK